MANVVINDTSEVRLYADKVIAQVESQSFIQPLLGEMNDMNAFVYRPSKMFQHGRYCTVPLRKAVTDDALEDGATYEGQGKKSIVSTTDIELNERGQVFGGQDTFEEMKTILDLREIHYQEAAQWHAADMDKLAFSKMTLSTSSLPTLANRAASQYNVDYVNNVASWAALGVNDFITAKAVSRAKVYFQKRGLRPGRIGGGRMAYLLVLPAEACYALAREDVSYREELASILPRSEDHLFLKGMGFNPWGAIDGVIIVQDLRPVYGGTDTTFLNVEDNEEGGFIKFQGVFMGAQALAYYEWKELYWSERIWDHVRKFEVAVSRMHNFAKPVINLGTLASASNRDYGMAYLCGTAPRFV